MGSAGIQEPSPLALRAEPGVRRIDIAYSQSRYALCPTAAQYFLERQSKRALALDLEG